MYTNLKQRMFSKILQIKTVYCKLLEYSLLYKRCNVFNIGEEWG